MAAPLTRKTRATQAAPDGMPAGRLFALRIDCARRAADRLAAALQQGGVAATVWQDWARRCTRIEAYFTSRAAAAGARDAMRLLPPALRPAPEAITLSVLPRQDWAESWKRYFHARRLSRRLWICPSWEAVPAAAAGAAVIHLDPGMSFGTGHHGTTRACLRLLDQLGPTVRGRTLLDIGCGSGILAIAGARLGFRRIAAVDNDPAAVHVARTNGARNGVNRRVAWLAGDLARLPLAQSYDVVVANILATVLIRHAEALSAAVSRDGLNQLILAGILNRQYPAVCRAVARHGWREVRRVRLGQWTSGRFTRPSPARR